MASLAGQAKGKSRRQLILAKRLKALDFNVPNSLEMSDEACAIVEAVFTDLVSTTEAYESLQGKEEQLQNELSKAQAQVFPLRKENTRLLRENNQLHMELIKAEDSISKSQQGHELEITRLEGRIKEAEFLGKQKDGSLSKARGENDHLKLQLKALLGGGGGAPSLRTTAEEEENANPNKSEFSAKDPDAANLQASENLPPSPRRQRREGASPSSPGPAYDQKVVEAMKQQLDEIKHRLELSEAECLRQKSACQSREKEVERLSALLEGGRDYDRVNAEHEAAGNMRMLDQLNRQVDFLNGQLAQREGQMATLQNEVRQTQRAKAEAKQATVSARAAEEMNSKLSSQIAELSEKLAKVEESNAALKKTAAAARKAASHAAQQAGLRDSGGSLPGSAGGRTPINSPRNSRSPAHSFNAPSVSISQQQHQVPTPTPTSTPTAATSAAITALQKEVTTLRIALASSESEATHLNADNDRLAAALEIAKTQSNVALSSTAEMGSTTNQIKARLAKVEADYGHSEQARERSEKEAAKLREAAGRMTEEINSLQQLVGNLSAENDGGGAAVERLRGELHSLTSLLSAKDVDITNLTNALKQASDELKETKRRMADDKMELDELRNKAGQSQSEAENVRYAAERHKTEAQEAAAMAGGARRQVEMERSVRQKLERELDDAKGKEKILGKRVQSLEELLEDAEDRLKGRERECVTLKERLMNMESLDPEGSARESSTLRKQLQNATARADSAESELEGVGRERSRVTMQLRRAEEEIMVLQRDIGIGKNEITKLRDEAVGMRDTCDFLEQGKSRAEAEREHLRAMLSEESASVGVRTETAGNLEREREKLIGRIAELESMLDSERKRRTDSDGRMTLLQDDSSRMGVELRKLQSAKADLENRLSRVNNELGEARGVVASMQGEIAGARAELGRERAARSAAEVREQQQAGTSREYQERHGQLKSLFGQLERTRDGLLRKLELQGGEIASGAERLERESGRNKALNLKCVKLEQEKEVLHRNLEVMDSEKDALANKMDEMSDSVRMYKSSVEEAERKLSELERVDGEVRDGKQAALKALDAREKEIVKLHSVVNSLQADCEELRRVCVAREREAERCSQDLVSMTREAQAMGVESSRLGGELTTTRKRLDEVSLKCAQIEHKCRAVELEKQDLLSAYRAVVDERGELEGGVEELGAERSGLRTELAAARGEVDRLSSVVGELEGELRRKSGDMAAFERQLDGISRSNLAIQRSLEAAESENRRLKTDLYAARQSGGGLARHSSELQRQAAEKSEEAGAMRSVVSALEAERDGLQRLLAEERNHGHGVETLLSGLRANLSASQEQVRLMAKENAGLQTQINGVNLKLKEREDMLEMMAKKGTDEVEVEEGEGEGGEGGGD
ncbi:hypothetical protein TrVE_jg10409 [Triparma verrucosa]|uniref:Uncharacterized protein n=1 Tax=Triparma verrucosa TaxID=1606542 RepID=A0A9W7KS21_9STRA|nr:hypothetical protein TrVE_jg10409 [Triparma verrucosa]